MTLFERTVILKEMPSIVPSITKTGQICYQNGANMLPKWGKYDTKIGQICYQNGANMFPKWGKYDTKIGQICYQNGANMLPKKV